MIRQHLIGYIDSDIICLNETHLLKDNELECANYTVIHHNRQEKHVKARKGSGGVAVLVKESVFRDFDVSVIDKAIDGLLVLKFVNLSTDFTFVLFACYLPPENSVWGRDPTSFFAHMISQLYLNHQADALFICGDFNGRVGNLSDVVEEIDDVPKRHILDKVKKGHGEALIEFVKDCKLALLNGRLDPEYDNFTFVSSRGKSVVDYFLTPHDCLQFCKSFRVDLVSDLIHKSQAMHLLGRNSKPPDHSVLTLTFRHSYWQPSYVNNQDQPKEQVKSERKMYLFDNKPEEFMNTPVWTQAVTEIIDNLSHDIDNKESMNRIYNDLCKVIFDELDLHLQFKTLTSPSKKRFKNHKPYWNAELQELWKAMVKEEKLFLKYTGTSKRTKILLRNNFKIAQRHFDRNLTAAARDYAHKQVADIENLSVDNHKEFWNKIRSLGPRKNNNVPIKVRIDGVLNNDEATVKSKWKQDFSNLLNGNNISDVQFNDEFLEQAINHKQELESNMTDTNSNEVLNREISVNEVISAVQKLKVRKAIGIDLIPNEVIKCPEVAVLFNKLFNVCLSSGLLPSVWQNAWIKPIPKGASKDPYVPLNYRGISLLSCVAKTYTGILNTRLSNFMKDNSLFPEEQNGFRQGRSCEDHIFSLTSIIRNRMAVNSSTYCAFVDFEKAFDWVNRDLLLYKLLCHGIDGHFYQSVKSILSNTKSCVLLNNYVQTEWFDINCGVRQGDSLSPTLFSIFINDVVDHLKSNCPSIQIGDTNLNCLLYADDMVLIGENEDSLQCLLNELKNWCDNWRVKVNESKTQVVHFRNKRSDVTNSRFMYDGKELEIKNSYRYLGVILDEHLDLNYCTQTLADAAGRAGSRKYNIKIQIIT